MNDVLNSRGWVTLGWLAISVVPIGAVAPADAQALYGPVNEKPESEKSISERADAALAREKAMFEDPTKRCKREAENSREIVVCADPDRNKRDRLPLRNETDSAKSTRTGVPRAPDLDGIKCRPGADGVCRGNIGRAPPPIYYIDLSKIPEAPPGSDADKIAKGEIPAP
ncbi:hypothetical protein [Novosphingobium sp.]|uniref:hypothetical protein n=1 Tax=Novosphingobium sp. TaxID=1874826 RepID=UPI0025F9C578|nr:hypothetical protein [Novosphingobium sp.]